MNLPKQQPALELNQPTQKSDRIGDYQFEPIKGYPMLNWRGKRPFTSTQYYPAQLKEVHGEEVDGWRNRIYWGDNLQVMSHLLKEFRGKVGLIYIDPPFDSKADYKKIIQIRGKSIDNDWGTFEDKQYADIWTNDEYLQFLYERIVLMRELLSSTGSFLIHCDWHKSHHIRCITDEIFGPQNFRNEIIWAYPGREMHINNKYNAKHDTVLFYAKTPETKIFMINIAIPYDKEERLKNLRRKVHKDDDGREWVWETRGQAAGQEPYRRYVEEILAEGKAINDVWDDVQFLRGNDPQRTGYPTQKPEDLLERIVLGHTMPTDIVFDCFMGSGTTQAVAMKLGRRFIGADINLGAIQTTTKRLLKVADELKPPPLDPNERRYTGFEVYNVNHYDVFRNPVEAKELLLEALEVNKLDQGAVFDGEKDGRMVKIMPVDRIATRADLNALITGLDYKAFERRQHEHPTQPVEKITLVCMGHEPDLKAHLEHEVKPYKLDVAVVDILLDKANLQFKRESEARVTLQGGELVVDRFYPMNLLQKLSLQKDTVGDWRELVESIMIDWNYDGAVLQPTVVDIPGKNALVAGRYKVPPDAGTVRVKITDLLSESWEGSVENG